MGLKMEQILFIVQPQLHSVHREDKEKIVGAKVKRKKMDGYY